MRKGERENTVRTQAAFARERGERQRSAGNGQPGRGKPGWGVVAKAAACSCQEPRLGAWAAAHPTGTSNGSNRMEHESCRIETVVFGEAGLPR